MKSEERHQLQTNELGTAAEKLREFVEEHGQNILIGIVAVAVVAGGLLWWISSSRTESQRGWAEIMAAQSAEDYAAAADKFAGTEVGAWARLKQAESLLATGIQESFTHRSSAVSDLKEAKESFSMLTDGSGIPGEVQERALYGLARTQETISGKDTADAIKTYEQLVRQFPQTVYKDEAESRIEQLKKEPAQEFYAWFQEQDPKPEDRAAPQDGGLPSGHPSINPGPQFPMVPDRLRNVSEDEPAGPAIPETNPAAPFPSDTPPSDTPKDSPSPESSATPDAPAKSDPPRPAEAPAAPNSEKPADGNKPADGGSDEAGTESSDDSPAKPPAPAKPEPTPADSTPDSSQE